MDLGRASKFGAIGALGTVVSLLVTLGVSSIVWSDRISGSEGSAIGTIVIVVLGGVAVTVIFLFVVVGGFIDRELEARGLGEREE